MMKQAFKVYFGKNNILFIFLFLKKLMPKTDNPKKPAIIKPPLDLISALSGVFTPLDSATKSQATHMASRVLRAFTSLTWGSVSLSVGASSFIP